MEFSKYHCINPIEVGQMPPKRCKKVTDDILMRCVQGETVISVRIMPVTPALPIVYSHAQSPCETGMCDWGICEEQC